MGAVRQKRRTVNLKNSLTFLTINFKAMKTIRNQIKYPIGLQL